MRAPCRGGGEDERAKRLHTRHGPGDGAAVVRLFGRGAVFGPGAAAAGRRDQPSARDARPLGGGRGLRPSARGCGGSHRWRPHRRGDQCRRWRGRRRHLRGGRRHHHRPPLSARTVPRRTAGRHRRRHHHHPHPLPVTPVEAGPDDAAAVVALWQAAGLTRPWNDPDADFARALAAADSAVLVLRDGAALIGSVLVGYDGHRGWVYYLAVAPDRRRHGLGRTLMLAAEAWLRARGCPKIQLMVRTGNADALAFYDRLGLAPQDVVTLGRFLDPEPA
ncbi:GNAT family acetyltransferase [Sphingomonas sp. ABOLF]|nr:GNAT family acetyltransferase [Sphingomonas sp. ABOLF]